MLDSTISRRRFAAGLAAGVAALAAPRAIARTATPVVDSLAVRVLVDAATFGPFLPDLSRPGLVVRRNTGVPAATMPRDALLGEFGLSLLATSRRGTDEARVLVDMGYSARTLANNMRLLGIDPARIDAAVLSHGHLDHYGGFAALGPRPRPLPLYIGGEEALCERVALIGDPPPLMGALDRAALAKAGYALRIAPEPAVVAGQAFTTGTIPLAGFERAAIPTRMRPGRGCDRAALAPAKRAAAQLPDDGEHELATAYHVRGLGLVVIASCSHRGVVNSVRQAQRVSGEARVHAVIGGFHLVRPRTKDEARRTVEALAAINPAYVVPMHCTGETFIEEAMRAMPEKIIRPYVGNELVFAA